MTVSKPTTILLFIGLLTVPLRVCFKLNIRFVQTVFFMLVLFLPGSYLYAHHGSGPNFDPNNMVTLNGTVSELRFVNPHAFVYFEAIDSDGVSVPWRCELSGASLLRRQGWTDETLVPGDEIKITGAMARREDNACAMESISFSDGSVINNQDDLQEKFIPIADSASIAERPRYLENGQPNLSGGWVSRVGGGPGGVLTNGAPKPTPAGFAASEQFEYIYDNSVINCKSGNIVLDWYRQSHVNEIRQEEFRIVIRYGYLDMVRTVHLDLTNHPENLESTVEGHSIGKWDGDVLVVDTVAMAAGALIAQDEIMMSDQARVVERFEYDSESATLNRSYEVTDPLFLEEPYSGINISDVAAVGYEPFNCVDLTGQNNRRIE